jgi:hypothetical protein
MQSRYARCCASSCSLSSNPNPIPNPNPNSNPNPFNPNPNPNPNPTLNPNQVLCGLLLALFAATSCYFAPLYFGFPMQPDEQARRVRRLDTWLDGHAPGSLFSFMRFS